MLHLVFGGELTSLDKIEFSNLKALDIVGIYPNYAQAYDAWKDAAHRTVDDAHMRYFIVHLHRLLDPENKEGCARARPLAGYPNGSRSFFALRPRPAAC